MKTLREVPVDRDHFARLMAPVRCYDCCECQASHNEYDPLFTAHHARQAKGGTWTRPPRPREVLRRCGEGG